MGKKRIAIINQRYGQEVNGGSEYYTKMLAEHLVEYYDVEVLTTTARDYDTWKSYYKQGNEVINGVKVKRFEVKHPRNVFCFKVLNKVMQILPEMGKRAAGTIWLEMQGPFCPDLVAYIENSCDVYDTFIFVTYLYYTTAIGIRSVFEKSILIPTAHDEKSIYFPWYREIFCRPKGIAYLTEEEEEFTERVFGNTHIKHLIAGVGIDIPKWKNEDGNILAKYSIQEPYVIYVGRVDKGKGCKEMFRYFERYKKEHPGGLKLVVIGKLMIREPKNKDILCLGYLNEDDKNDLIANARTLILPSKFESLSLAVLESFSAGVPVLVNGKCGVLKAHCQRSHAGISYESYDDFDSGLFGILNNEDRYARMKYMALKYIEDNYTWPVVINKYRMLLEG